MASFVRTAQRVPFQEHRRLLVPGGQREYRRWASSGAGRRSGVGARSALCPHNHSRPRAAWFANGPRPGEEAGAPDPWMRLEAIQAQVAAKEADHRKYFATTVNT